MTSSLLLVLGAIGAILNLLFISIAHFSAALADGNIFYTYWKWTAGADATVGLLVLPWTASGVLRQARGHVIGEAEVQVFGVAFTAAYFVSLYSFTMAMCNRVQALCRPLRHVADRSKSVDKRRLTAMSLVGLGAAALPPAIGCRYRIEGKGFPVVGNGHIVAAVALAPVLINTLLLAVSLVKLRRSYRFATETLNRSGRGLVGSKELNHAVNNLILFGAFALAVVPAAVVAVLQEDAGPDAECVAAVLLATKGLPLLPCFATRVETYKRETRRWASRHLGIRHPAPSPQPQRLPIINNDPSRPAAAYDGDGAEPGVR